MKRIKPDTINKKTTFFISLLVMVVASVVVPILLKTNTQVQYKSIYSGYIVGEISEKTVYAKASIDLIDEVATQKARDDAGDAVLPVFTYSSIRTSQIISNADKIRSAMVNNDIKTLDLILGADLARQVFTMDSADILSTVYDVVNAVMQAGYFDSSEIEQVKGEGYSRIVVSNRYSNLGNVYEREVSLDGGVITIDDMNSYLGSALSGLIDGLSAREVMLLDNVVRTILRPNIMYDSALTRQRRESARNSADTVVISVEKGQILIEKDHVVTHEDVDLLRLLSTQSNSFSFVETVGHLLFDLIILSFGLYVFGMFLGSKDMHYVQHHIVLVVAYVLSLAATFFLTLISSKLNLEFSDSFLPVFFLPLFMTEVTGYKRVGFTSIIIFAAVLSTLPTASLMTFFYCATCGSACVFLIRFFNRRIDMVYQWFFSCILCSGITIVFMLINQVSFRMIFTVILGTLMNVSFAYVLLGALLPVVERLFNLPTIFRLYELAYGDSPILTRLSQACPGTYSHSLAVADLAEVGAKAIGANSLLARVGGLYHDIGKIEHPEYFVENQSGVNKHDDISPSLSVAVIKSHVKVGADKGREAGLPVEVIKIISNHHGNDVIQYFYHEAMTQAAAVTDRGETVKASDFSYNAEIPGFRECGIVMLADSIEAASRTVTPNASKYAKLIDSIFMGKIERGQLDNSNLTMNDIKTLSETFVKALVSRNHSRVEYPDEDDR